MILSALESWLQLLESTGAPITSNHYKDVPIAHSIKLLGLHNLLPRMQGKKLCDIGCGTGLLVEHLRVCGVDAYGIDARAPPKPYFTGRMVTGPRRIRGIPVPAESFDYLTSFQNISLNTLFRFDRQEFINNHLDFGRAIAEGYYEAQCYEAIAMISEIVRTLRPGGSAFIYPAPVRFVPNDVLREKCKLTATYETIEGQSVIDYLKWEGGPHLSRSEEFAPEFPDYIQRFILRKVD